MRYFMNVYKVALIIPLKLGENFQKIIVFMNQKYISRHDVHTPWTKMILKASYSIVKIEAFSVTF